MNLAKQPASTIQILGAEKALFRALKTKHETPKYGLIYHASLIGQAPPKFKGKIARVLAAKCALSTRYDALGEAPDAEIGLENRAKVRAHCSPTAGRWAAYVRSAKALWHVQVEARLRQLEGMTLASSSAALGLRASQQKYNPQAQGASAAISTDRKAYNPAADVVANGSGLKKQKVWRTARLSSGTLGSGSGWSS